MVRGGIGKQLAVGSLCLALTHQPAEASANNPYDPDNIRAHIGLARQAHVTSPNYPTMDISLTNRSGKPATAEYVVIMSFNRPQHDPTDNPQQCPIQPADPPDVQPGTYRCTVVISGPSAWEFNATINQPGNLQHVLKTVSTTLNFVDAAELRFGWPEPHRGLPRLLGIVLWASTTGAGLLLLSALVVLLRRKTGTVRR